MAEQIQRQPGGLAELLLTFGGVTPREIAPEVKGVLELLQFYGLGTRRIITASGAPVEGGALTVATPANWSVLFAAETNFTKTATLTALSVSLMVSRFPNISEAICVAAAEYTAFGATATGGTRLPFVPPYAWLLPPLTNIFAVPDIIGTDATLTMGVRAEIGVLA